MKKSFPEGVISLQQIVKGPAARSVWPRDYLNLVSFLCITTNYVAELSTGIPHCCINFYGQISDTERSSEDQVLEANCLRLKDQL